MAEPAIKIEKGESAASPKKAGEIIKFEISAKPTGDKTPPAGKIVNFPQSDRNQNNHRRNFDRQIRQARREISEAADQEPPPKTEAAKKPAAEPPAKEKNDQESDKASPELSPEQKIADRNKQGAPMEGVSESAGLTGGTGGFGNSSGSGKTGENSPQAGQTAPSEKETRKKPEENQPGQVDQPNGENKKSSPEAAGGPETEQGMSMTREQMLKRQLAEKKKEVKTAQTNVEKNGGQNQDENGLKRIFSRQGRADRNLKKKKKEEAKLKKALTKHVKIKEALKQSWLNLITSWGATYLYIMFHFLNVYFTPWANLFSKFGEEWLPSAAFTVAAQSSKEKKAPGIKQASKMLEIIEIAGCVLIGLLMFAAIILTATIFISAVYVISNPFSVLVSLGWDVVKRAAGFTN